LIVVDSRRRSDKLGLMTLSRRALLAGLGAAAASSAWRTAAAAAPFNLSILTDEISQDFGHACEVASREFGLGLVGAAEAELPLLAAAATSEPRAVGSCGCDR